MTSTHQYPTKGSWLKHQMIMALYNNELIPKMKTDKGPYQSLIAVHKASGQSTPQIYVIVFFARTVSDLRVVSSQRSGRK